jgi:hypothetical protein
VRCLSTGPSSSWEGVISEAPSWALGCCDDY